VFFKRILRGKRQYFSIFLHGDQLWGDNDDYLHTIIQNASKYFTNSTDCIPGPSRQRSLAGKNFLLTFAGVFWRKI
jgi:hypothetical protein